MLRFFRILILLGVVSSSYAQSLDQFDLKKGIGLSGSVNTSFIGYTASGIEARRDPLDMYLTGNLNLNVVGYDLPFSFAYSNRKTNYTQPFNAFQFNPSYKWAKAYFGSSTMTFSDYTLAGHRFDGVGVELTPGKWEMAAMYGRLKKAVEFDDQEPLRELSYKRTGYGVKVGYNGDKFGLGGNFFTASDQAGSLLFVPHQANLNPMGNKAGSVWGKKSFLKYFFVDAEYSFSFINIKPGFFYGQADSIDSKYKQATSRYYDAMNFGIGYQGQWFGLQLRYERVAPDYKSLGAYYFTDDMQNITIMPNLRLFSGKLTISGNTGFQRDNLDNSKTSVTRRFVGSANVSYVLSEKWNFTGNYSNFNSYTRNRMQPDPYFKDELDSLNFYQISQTFNVSAMHNFGNTQSKQSVMLALSYQKTGEEQKANPNLAGANIFSGNTSYTYNITQYNLSMSLSANYNRSHMGKNVSTFIGPLVNLSKGLVKNKLKASWAINYSNNKMSGEFDSKSSTLNNRWGLNYTPASKEGKKGRHNAGLNVNFMRNFGSFGKTASYNELTSTLNYNYSF